LSRRKRTAASLKAHLRWALPILAPPEPVRFPALLCSLSRGLRGRGAGLVFDGALEATDDDVVALGEREVGFDGAADGGIGERVGETGAVFLVEELDWEKVLST
jgi:hypothetical protein